MGSQEILTQNLVTEDSNNPDKVGWLQAEGGPWWSSSGLPWTVARSAQVMGSLLLSRCCFQCKITREQRDISCCFLEENQKEKITSNGDVFALVHEASSFQSQIRNQGVCDLTLKPLSSEEDPLQQGQRTEIPPQHLPGKSSHQ